MTRVLLLFAFCSALAGQSFETTQTKSNGARKTPGAFESRLDSERRIPGREAEQSEIPTRSTHGFKYSLVALTAASVADAATSYGGRETNPLLGRGAFGPRQLAIKGGITAALVGAEVGIVRRHPAMRKPLAFGNWIAAGAIGAIAYRNGGIR